MSTKVKIPNSTDNDIRFAGLRDVVQVYDPYKKEWKDWRRTGVVILPSSITVTTTTLNGEPVTCQINEESYTTTFIDGAAHFHVLSTGTATITCGDVSVTIDITTDNQEYTAELNEFTEIVLLEGNIPQNGATYSYGVLEYAVAAGDLIGRSLRYTVKEIFGTSVGLAYYLYYASNNIFTRVDMTGVNSGQTWPTTYIQSGNVYTHSFETLLSNKTVTDDMLIKFNVKPYNSSGNSYLVSDVFSKVELI